MLAGHVINPGDCERITSASLEAFGRFDGPSPGTVEASSMRSSDVKGTEDVRSGVPRRGGLEDAGVRLSSVASDALRRLGAGDDPRSDCSQGLRDEAGSWSRLQSYSI